MHTDLLFQLVASMAEMVLQNLFNSDLESQIQGATLLGRLTAKQRQLLVEKGVITPLISMLHSHHYHAIQAALYALLNLAFSSERNKRQIVKSGVTPMLLQLLQSENSFLIEHALAAMLVFSTCTPNKLEIAYSGAIQLLVEILGGHCCSIISIQAKLDTLSTLHNLSTCHQIIPLLVSSGIVHPLLCINHENDKYSQLAAKAMMLLEKIVSLSEKALQETASTGGAIQMLVEAIEDGSLQCKEDAASILLLICRSCRETYREPILREGVMPGLLQLSIDGTPKAKETAQDLLLLLRDNNSSYSLTRIQPKYELVEQIMQEIDTQGDATALRLLEQMIANLAT